VSGIGSNKPFQSLIVNIIPCLDLLEKNQCFPFYIYSEDGQHRQENVTDWALDQFRQRYSDATIEKWDIFYYVYGALHNQAYRQKYAANLRRELPRIPHAPDLQTFRSYSESGKKLAELHLNYEQHAEYPLTRIYAPDQPHNWEVQKMKLNKDKTAIIYNDWLTLSGIPKEAFEYCLGNRSALEWVIEQYQVKTDSRSGIVNNPNRDDDPQYIVRLLGQVIQVSLETVKIVKELPQFVFQFLDGEPDRIR
jgi:predicted helicase